MYARSAGSQFIGFPSPRDLQTLVQSFNAVYVGGAHTFDIGLGSFPMVDW